MRENGDMESIICLVAAVIIGVYHDDFVNFVVTSLL